MFHGQPWEGRTWVGGKDPGPAQGWWVMGDSSALDLHVLCLGLLWGPGRRPKVGEGKEDLYKSFQPNFCCSKEERMGQFRCPARMTLFFQMKRSLL